MGESWRKINECYESSGEEIKVTSPKGPLLPTATADRVLLMKTFSLKLQRACKAEGVDIKATRKEKNMIF
jgi:hypothetical protein